MATYASSSNPFIKTNCASGDLEEPPKKMAAPGMAMPHKQMTDMRKLKDSESPASILGNESTLIETSASTTQSPHSKDREKVDVILDLNSNYTEPIETEDLREFDEISKACESLVETTIRLELEEAAAAAASRVSLVNEDQSKEQEQKPDGLEANRVQDGADADADIDADADAEHDPKGRDSGHHQHIELIKKLRLQLHDLERYAYERGELGEVPASVIAERQTVILDTLKERLSLRIDMNEIEKLELDELKKQVDKEIHDLIDPLITKDHLLGQLKTQLTDLEQYISYLHGAIGKIHDKSTCTCHLHGCCTSKLAELSAANEQTTTNTSSENHGENSLINNDALPKTTKLIRSLVTQLICSDIKLRESAKKAQLLEENSKPDNSNHRNQKDLKIPSKGPKADDDAAWSLHIDKVVLATDSLVNLFTAEPGQQRASSEGRADDRLVESIVRRQLVPALRDLLSYGLIDPASLPKSTSYVSLLFDPYYLLTSLTCFPSSHRANSPAADRSSSLVDKIHVWHVIEEYFKSRNDPSFKSSSVKTLSQSFDLAPSVSGPIKITSKQALLIAIDDIIETLSKSKPNGPESHFRAFIYVALNRSKLSTWLRIIFKNKSIIRMFYHNFSFISQPEKVDKLLATVEPLGQFVFKLRTDVESIEQFVSAF